MSRKLTEREKKVNKLLRKIKRKLPELKKLFKEINKYEYEDTIYRFYHYSYKVYYIQDLTIKIIKQLKALTPKETLFNETYEKIFQEGTGKKFKYNHNDNWLKHTRPLLEAFFHAKYFLEMSIKYGKELDQAPKILPSGWAGLLYFYNLR